MLSLISFSTNFGNIYDVQVNKWHGYEASMVLCLATANGRLVYYTSLEIIECYKFGFFNVVNPLTKQSKQLPPLLHMGAKKSSNNDKDGEALCRQDN